MPSVAIRKRMNPDKAVMKSDGNFVGWVNSVGDLEDDIVEKQFQFDTDLMPQ